MLNYLSPCHPTDAENALSKLTSDLPGKCKAKIGLNFFLK